MGKFALEKPIGGDLDHVTKIGVVTSTHVVKNYIPMGFNIDPCPNNS